MEYCPDWYDTIRAARYLRVPPWELQRAPLIWTIWAREAESAESYAMEQQKRIKNQMLGDK